MSCNERRRPGPSDHCRFPYWIAVGCEIRSGSQQLRLPSIDHRETDKPASMQAGRLIPNGSIFIGSSYSIQAFIPALPSESKRRGMLSPSQVTGM